MKPLIRLTALAAVLASMPLAAHAQTDTNPAFQRPFVFNERDGTGTLTITSVADTAGAQLRRIRTELVQAGRTYTGAGVYSENPSAGILESPIQLYFTLADTTGRTFFFSGTLSRSGSSGYAGQGTYFLVSTPENAITWRIQSQDTGSGGDPDPEPIVSSSPTLRGGWVQQAFSEAIGGTYYGTYNTNQGVAATATWSGSLPASGQYRVEAFIPRQRTGFTPRTERATYRIGSTQTDVIQRISQNQTTSGWVDLGTYTLGTTYTVVLSDETGETAFTRSVIANAIRLVPVTGTGGGTGGGGTGGGGGF